MSGRTGLRLALWLAGLLALPEVLGAQALGSQAFRTLLSEAGMELGLPPGFHDQKVLENVQLPYEGAVVGSEGLMEIRYSIRPLARIVVDYDDPHSAKPEPNHMFPLMFQAILGRIARHGHNPSSEYPVEQARKKFGADWASAAVFDVDPDYAPGRPLGLLLGLHKNQVADAYAVFLFERYEEAKPLLDETLTALRFAPGSQGQKAAPAIMGR